MKVKNSLLNGKSFLNSNTKRTKLIPQITI
jgi:hypothetical protein